MKWNAGMGELFTGGDRQGMSMGPDFGTFSMSSRQGSQTDFGAILAQRRASAARGPELTSDDQALKAMLGIQSSYHNVAIALALQQKGGTPAFKQAISDANSVGVEINKLLASGNFSSQGVILVKGTQYHDHFNTNAVTVDKRATVVETTINPVGFDHAARY